VYWLEEHLGRNVEFAQVQVRICMQDLDYSTVMVMIIVVVLKQVAWAFLYFPFFKCGVFYSRFSQLHFG
jgi:hypothetical protein